MYGRGVTVPEWDPLPTHVAVQHLPLRYHLRHGSIFHHDSTFHRGSMSIVVASSIMIAPSVLVAPSIMRAPSILVLANIRSPRAQRCKYKTSQAKAFLTMAAVREYLGRIPSSAFHHGSTFHHDRAASLSNVGRGSQ